MKAANPPLLDSLDYLRIEQVLDLVRFERKRQIDAHGREESREHGAGDRTWAEMLKAQANENRRARGMGAITWRHVLLSNFYAAMVPSDPEQVKTGIVKLAATCLAMIEDLDNGIARGR